MRVYNLCVQHIIPVMYGCVYNVCVLKVFLRVHILQCRTCARLIYLCKNVLFSRKNN